MRFLLFIICILSIVPLHTYGVTSSPGQESLAPVDSDSDKTPPQKASPPPPAHIHGLTPTSPDHTSLLDSRGMLEKFTFQGRIFTNWHEDAQTKLREWTQKVNKALSKESGKPSNKNLLRYRVSFQWKPANEKTQSVRIESPDAFWISGWPAQKPRATLSKEFPDTTFRFFDDLLPPEQRDLPANEKVDLIRETFFIGYHYPDESPGCSYLEQARQEHIRRAVARTQGPTCDYSFFNRTFMHTEQALMYYLSTEGFLEILRVKMQDVPSNHTGTVHLVVNVASCKSACLHCADRMFRESEWGQGFLGRLRNEFDRDIRLVCLMSAMEAYPDFIGDTTHEKPYKTALQRRKTKYATIGFDGKGKIDFCASPNGRPKFNGEPPLVGQKLSESRREK